MGNIGLVLTGGGARSAYQAGVLKGIAEIWQKKESPFKVIAGVSAGAINGAYLASGKNDFSQTAEILWKTWYNLHIDHVFRTDTFKFATIGMKFLRDLTLGGLSPVRRANYLLDTSPLRHMLGSNISFEAIQENLEQGILHGVSFTATNYLTGSGVSFYDGHPKLEPWVRSHRFAKRTRITLDHVMASSAIPVFFPPVKIDGAFYGDGCIRMISPFSPAIHLGSERVLAIGVRHPRTEAEVLRINAERKSNGVTLAEISGVLLNSVFLDSLDADLERLERINRTIQLLDKYRGTQPAQHPDHLRHIPVLTIRPSKDLGSLASSEFSKFPGMFKHALRGIGAKNNKGWELISYLAFETSYTSQLLALGYEDALTNRDAILTFLQS